MNHAMCYPFVPIIIAFVRILLNYYIITIMLTVVLYHRLWLIIRVIVFSTSVPIMILSFFTEKIVFGVTIFWPMGDTQELIGGLVPIILME